MAEWITDRLPTAEDADAEGDVRIRRTRDPELFQFAHWSCVVPGQPWWSRNAAARVAQPTPPPAPAPTSVVTAMAATQYRVFAACSDGTMWDWTPADGKWRQFHSIPQPEASDA
jgi:hypothetical protein